MYERPPILASAARSNGATDGRLAPLMGLKEHSHHVIRVALFSTPTENIKYG